MVIAGKVPVLLHESRTYYESMITCQYVDEAFPGPRLSSLYPGHSSQPFYI
jgi:glutathione S-transferase